MPILGIIASSISGNLSGDFESIATVSVGSGGAANVELTSIHATYTHLQIRGIARSTIASTGGDWVYCQFNADTGSNYAHHRLFGNGSSAGAGAATSQTEVRVGSAIRNNTTASIYGVSVVDILDYANTNKNTTTRSFIGSDTNGGGEVILYSGLWMNTAAITSIKLYPEVNNFLQYTTFALYGIRSA